MGETRVERPTRAKELLDEVPLEAFNIVLSCVNRYLPQVQAILEKYCPELINLLMLLRVFPLLSSHLIRL